MKDLKEYLPEILAKPDSVPLPDTLIGLINQVAELAEAVKVDTLPAIHIYIQRLPKVQQASFWRLIIRRNEADLVFSKEATDWAKKQVIQNK